MIDRFTSLLITHYSLPPLLTKSHLLITHQKCQESKEKKADESVEKVPKTKLDKLPEVAISYRLQVFAREKTAIPSVEVPPKPPNPNHPRGAL